jgi:hypothetical protein
MWEITEHSVRCGEDGVQLDSKRRISSLIPRSGSPLTPVLSSSLCARLSPAECREFSPRQRVPFIHLRSPAFSILEPKKAMRQRGSGQMVSEDEEEAAFGLIHHRRLVNH